MDKIPEIVSASISRNIEDVSRISINTQNVNRVGFKALINNSSTSSSASSKIGKIVDLSQGELRKTERTLDLAVQGNGWFVLRKGNAVTLTRNGQLQLDNQGFITGNNGFRLQGVEGDMLLESTSIKVDGNGSVFSDDREIGKILLVKAPDISTNQYRLGHIYYQHFPRLEVDESSRVLQGFLEQSNVDPSSEVVNLMKANRHIQTMQKSLAVYDQVINKVITELGN